MKRTDIALGVIAGGAVLLALVLAAKVAAPTLREMLRDLEFAHAGRLAYVKAQRDAAATPSAAASGPARARAAAAGVNEK